MRLRAIIIVKEVGGKRKFVTGGDWGSDFCRMWSSVETIITVADPSSSASLIVLTARSKSSSKSEKHMKKKLLRTNINKMNTCPI